MTKPFRARRPPFAALIAFDAIARHGSVTLAADELALTQSAISHRLKVLESYFGVALLERLNPGLRLTEAGQRLVREIVPILGHLARLDDAVVRPNGRPIFRLGVGQALLTWWLSRRLPALAAVFADVAIEVQPLSSQQDAVRGRFDLALMWLPHTAVVPSKFTLSLPIETVFPVAAPRSVSVAKASCKKGWQWSLPIIDKQALDNVPPSPEWSWSTWLGRDNIRQTSMVFRDVGAALQSASDGNGAALGRSLLVADAIKENRLIALVPESEARLCTKVQVAHWSDASHSTAEEIAHWIARVATATLLNEQPRPVK